MALINCPECQRSVSEDALKCPGCGVQLRKPRRGFIGQLFKVVFIGFNALMLLWLVGGVGSGSNSMANLSSDVERAGGAVGMGIAVTFILLIWVVGSLILGMLVLLTRPKA